MKFRTTEIATGVSFLIFSLVYVFYITPNFVTNPLNDASMQTMAWTLRPEALPSLNIGVFVVFSLVMTYQAIRSRNETLLDLNIRSFGKVIFVVIWSFIYTFLLPIFGFLLISPVFMAVLILAFGLRNWMFVLGVSILMPVFLDTVFFQTFQIILPEGALWK
jgi:hypothetical protein|tara:strand:+ start:545 stop:1030 length:486 start_codon:yes stop_codon:yes gene_type:complete